MSHDPIGIEGGLNLYVFCANNPVNFTDPFGLELLDKINEAMDMWAVISVVNINNPLAPHQAMINDWKRAENKLKREEARRRQKEMEKNGEKSE